MGENRLQPLLKLCGNHSFEDTKNTLSSNADYLGFVFAKSKRQVRSTDILNWLSMIDKQEKKIVALFVNEPASVIFDTISNLPIDIIQCHGNETSSELAEVKEITQLPVWKAIHHSEHALEVIRTYRGISDGYIIDCKVGSQWGGTGVSFDWTFIPHYLQEGREQGVPVFIAGGINPDNIEKVLAYQPDGIDVSSGIEENNQKSMKLIKQLEERMIRHGYTSR